MPKHVNKARKEHTCGNCDKTIKIGEPYNWHKFNFGSTIKQCDAPACAFRQSDLTTSDKLSRLYGVMESAEDQIGDWDREDVEALRSIMEEAANEIREVGEEYQESRDNMEEAFPGGCPMMDDCEEKANACEGWADEIEGMDFEKFDPDDHEPGDLSDARDSWADDQIANAQDAIGNCPL